ncbi:hypothetical protein BJ508DRAFT_332543 [Ascobolus immersus RN42]|uniref:Uncharacterized protein n=1 Tax=Ascobolus immersus RN42 TaxID=1160509 RepID=A0A3N4HSE3_ASCIM|nr:hypothetical protein BJ508DRAFT_332543 [Ascobolus immersus RN42]
MAQPEKTGCISEQLVQLEAEFSDESDSSKLRFKAAVVQLVSCMTRDELREARVKEAATKDVAAEADSLQDTQIEPLSLLAPELTVLRSNVCRDLAHCLHWKLASFDTFEIRTIQQMLVKWIEFPDRACFGTELEKCCRLAIESVFPDWS